MQRNLGKMRINIARFEKWYANQIKYYKVAGEEPGKDAELEAAAITMPEMEMRGVCWKQDFIVDDTTFFQVMLYFLVVFTEQLFAALVRFPA